MKFTCERYVLLSAVTTASRAASAKSPIPALEGLLVEAGNNVRITGYDLKKGIYTAIEADVQEPGAIILGARIFSEIVRSLPEGRVCVSVENGNLAKIVCGQSEFSIMGTDADDFPEFPEVDKKSSLAVSQKTLKSMINQTLFAVSDNESRPVYTGSLFEMEAGLLTLVSVDGYRLALRREKMAGGSGEVSFIVPGNALSDLEKICADSDDPVGITVGSKHISFSIGNTVLISRRLEGEFLNYRKAVPETFRYTMKAERQELCRVVDRVSLIIDDRVKNPIRCRVGDGAISMTCVTALGRADDVCPVEGSGEGLEISFNNRYLLDALKAAPADKVSINMSTSSSPCVILPSDGGDSFLYMILPVRLKAGE